uniref:Uncharacterized protein n=1 Tax=Rhizophora mucronata TaxID=61149 RepID=A0A2P2M4M4_RHIMU
MKSSNSEEIVVRMRRSSQQSLQFSLSFGSSFAYL